MKYDKERVDFLLTQEKTADVVNELLKLNYGLLVMQLKKFYLTKDPDAISFGYEALYNAIITYAPGKSAFSTFASVCIYNRLGSHVRSLNTQILSNTTYLEQPVDDIGTTLLDKLEVAGTVDENILSEVGVDYAHRVFLCCYTSLKNDLHKQIISLWYESGFTMTQGAIAEELGCTQTYVSQTIKRFRAIMKQLWEAG